MTSGNSSDSCDKLDFKTGKIKCERCCNPEELIDRSRVWCKIQNPDGDNVDLLDTFYPCSPYRLGTSIITPNPFYVARKKKCICNKKIKKSLSLIIVDNALYDEICKEKRAKKDKKKSENNFEKKSEKKGENKPTESKWYSFMTTETYRRKQAQKLCKERKCEFPVLGTTERKEISDLTIANSTNKKKRPRRCKDGVNTQNSNHQTSKNDKSANSPNIKYYEEKDKSDKKQNNNHKCSIRRCCKCGKRKRNTDSFERCKTSSTCTMNDEDNISGCSCTKKSNFWSWLN